MSAINSIVATFSNHRLTEKTVKELQSAKFDMRKLSVVSRKKMDISGLSVAHTINEIFASNEALSICVPEESLQVYEAELEAGRSMLVAYGNADEMARAKNIIESCQPEGWDGSADTSVYYGCST